MLAYILQIMLDTWQREVRSKKTSPLPKRNIERKRGSFGKMIFMFKGLITHPMWFFPVNCRRESPALHGLGISHPGKQAERRGRGSVGIRWGCKWIPDAWKVWAFAYTMVTRWKWIMEYASGSNLQMFHAIRSNIYFNERLDRNLWRNSWDHPTFGMSLRFFNFWGFGRYTFAPFHVRLNSH